MERAKTCPKRLTPQVPSGTFDKLFVGGIPLSCTRAELQQYFGRFGKVRNVLMPRRTRSRPTEADPGAPIPNVEFRGFAYVVFADPEVARGVLSLSHFLYGRQVRSSARPSSRHAKAAPHFPQA